MFNIKHKSYYRTIAVISKDSDVYKILKSYGLPIIDDGYFEINKDIDITFLSARAQIDTALLEAGIPMTEEYFYETYKLPKPKPDDKLINSIPNVGAGLAKSGLPKPKKPKSPDLSDDIEDLKNQINSFKSFFDQAGYSTDNTNPARNVAVIT